MKKSAQFYSTITMMIMTVFSGLFAQSSISGSVTDQSGIQVPFADVRLLQAADEKLVKGQSTDADGRFQLKNIPAGKYIVAVSMLGFKESRYPAIAVDGAAAEQQLGPIVLVESVTMMEAVEVAGKAPPVILQSDRLVVNVANTITFAGSTALEVLERSPGVMVDRQNNGISLSGKSGVVVMINGRINYMSASAVVQLLSGMSADNIEKIEIYTTPPAKFDAEGNAGYLNIILKKSIDDGLNGSYALTVGYGNGETGNGSINFNYRKGKLNLYGDYAYLRNGQQQNFSLERSVVLENELHKTSANTLRDPLQQNHNGRLGIDLQLSKKTVVGALFSSYDTKWTMDAANHAMSSINAIPEQVVDIQVTELNQWRHYGGNLNLQHTFQEGETLNFDADLLYYRDNNPTNYLNRYFDGNNNFDFEESTRSGKVTPITIGVGKLDYARNLGDKIKVTSGLKGTVSHFNNDVDVATLNGQVWQSNSELTAQYELQESVLAAYTALDITLDEKTSAKVGMRYEYTNTNLGSVETKNIVDRQYGSFFPSVFLSRKLHEDHAINLSYSRRITRPTFKDMAPFVQFIDPTTFFSGNPALQPAFSDNFKLDYRFKSAVFTLQYSVEDSTIASFQSRIIPGTNDQLLFAENLQGQQTASLTLAVPFSPKPWWNMFFNTSGVWQQSNVYVEDRLINLTLASVNIFTSQNFSLPRNFALELSGFFNSGALSGAYIMKPFGVANVGVQKKLAGGNSTLRLGVDNFLNTQIMRMHSELPELQQSFSVRAQFANPTVKLSFSHNFGNRKMKGQRKRAMGSEAEQKRVGN
jgi:outer membrane receptor protein involved in Fe transport